MKLRPINAIFVEPKAKFIVIYQDGSLWQLTRMRIDKNSWQRRQAYTGDKNAIFLRPNQTIDDEFLANLLPTETLPQNLVRVTLPKFLSWWQLHAYDFLQEKAENSGQAEQARVPNIESNTTPNSEKTEQSVSEPADTNSSDAFDNMLDDWENW